MRTENTDRERQVFERNVFKFKIAALLLAIVAVTGFLTSSLSFDDRFYATALLLCLAALIFLLKEPLARLAHADQRYWERTDPKIRKWFGKWRG